MDYYVRQDYLANINHAYVLVSRIKKRNRNCSKILWSLLIRSSTNSEDKNVRSVSVEEMCPRKKHN